MEISKIISVLKFPLDSVVTLLFFCSGLLLLPDKIQIFMGLYNYKNDNKQQIGAVFLLSISYILTRYLFSISNYLKKKLRQYITKRNGIQTLKTLSSSEKVIIQKMLGDGSNSTMLDISDGYHARLQHMFIIYQASTMSKHGTVFSFGLNPWVIEFFRKNPKIRDQYL